MTSWGSQSQRGTAHTSYLTFKVFLMGKSDPQVALTFGIFVQLCVACFTWVPNNQVMM